MKSLRTDTIQLLTWTCCNMILQLPLLLSWILSLSFISDAFQGTVGLCKIGSATNSAISILFAIIIVVSVSELLLHAAVLISAVIKHFKNPIFNDVGPNTLSVSATALTAVRLLLTLVGTFLGIYVSTQCQQTDISAIILIFVITGWIAIALNGICAFVMTRGHIRSRTVDDWRSLTKCLLCHTCWFGKNRIHDLEEQGFTSIAKHLQHIAVDFPDLSFSDTILTLTLVRSLQIARRNLGYCSGDIISGLRIHSSCEGDSCERAHCLPLSDAQPQLNEDDWERIRLAKHYYKYSLAAYGAPLHAIMKPYAVCCLPNCFQSNRKNIHSSGCCFCSIKAFLLRSGIDPSDLIYANLTSQAGTAVFYVCADHETQTMVVSVRGTHSVQDLLNDLLIDLQMLDDYGFPGSHVHSGVFNAAMKILSELRDSEAVQMFLEAHPSYRIVLNGHSFGSAVASSMALMCQKVANLCPWKGRSLLCFAYAPLQIADITIAESDIASCITAIVFRNDIIPRLSLRSIRRLKILMASLLDIAKSNQCVLYLSRSDVLRSASSRSNSKLAFISNLAGDNGFFRSVENVLQMASEPKLYVPGRLFHIVKEKHSNAEPRFCGIERIERMLIYPLDRTSLDEIIVSKSMMVQHFPQAYLDALGNLQIPDRTLEIVIEDVVS